jgi:nucleotide-binding universal stress UspA family protein
MKVLLASDGSIEAELAEAILEKLPFPQATDIDVAMVVPTPTLSTAGVLRNPLPVESETVLDRWRLHKQIARHTVDRIAHRLQKLGFAAEPFVLEGETADELVQLAAKRETDLLASGSGVSGEFAAFFLGSVSRMLALNSPTSVLIGRHYADAPAEGSFKRIKSKHKLDVLIAVDGSRGSQFAVDSLARIGRPIFRKLSVAVIEPLRDGGDYDAANPVPGSPYARDLACESAARLESCCEEVDWHIGFGRPSVEISRIAALARTDLILLGANRHGLVERLLLGSCAYETATSAPCSVLIFRDVLEFDGHRVPPTSAAESR